MSNCNILNRVYHLKIFMWLKPRFINAVRNILGTSEVTCLKFKSKFLSYLINFLCQWNGLLMKTDCNAWLVSVQRWNYFFHGKSSEPCRFLWKIKAKLYDTNWWLKSPRKKIADIQYLENRSGGNDNF